MYNIAQLKAELKRDEGVRQKPYKDSVGILTIGVGRNLDQVGLRPDEIEYLLEKDIAQAALDVVAIFPEWENLTDARQRVLLNMAFNLGRSRLSKFTGMLAALRNSDYDKAAEEMLDSTWAKQVGPRSQRLEAMMREG